MHTTKRLRRGARARAMNRILRKLFPDTRIELTHGSTWELLVAVQLSAQCTDARVNQVTPALFKKYRTIRAYARAPQEEMERLIFSTGFYRNKARNIRAAAQRILDIYGGRVPERMSELLTLPGVARKTANVVLSNAFGRHEGIAVDTHVRRFALRFDLTDFTDPVRIERDLMELMPQRDWWGFNHRLVLYGRHVCPARKHDCDVHPLTPIYPKAAKIWPRSA
jgi:endonuclease III